MLAEARNLLQAYARKCVNIHFENLNDMIFEKSIPFVSIVISSSLFHKIHLTIFL